MLLHLIQTTVCPRALRGPQASLLTERERDDLFSKVTSIYKYLQTCFCVYVITFKGPVFLYLQAALPFFNKSQLLL